MKVHFIPDPDLPHYMKCGRGFDHPNLTTTTDRDKVTCRQCRGFSERAAEMKNPYDGCAPKESEPIGTGDFLTHYLRRQRRWSEETFGPDYGTKRITDHIRKELLEIEREPEDLEEWIDVVILALDGAWRTGATPAQIIEALHIKQLKNQQREWPDWRTADPDKAIEHIREDFDCEWPEKECVCPGGLNAHYVDGTPDADPNWGEDE